MNTRALHATYSIQQRLTLRISLQAMLVMALMAAMVYLSVHIVVDRRQTAELAKKNDVVLAIFTDGARIGGLEKAIADVRDSAYRRPLTRLSVQEPNGRLLFEDANEAPFVMSDHPRTRVTDLELSPLDPPRVVLTLQSDTAYDRELMIALGKTLLAVPLLGGLLVALSSLWRIRRDLKPLNELAAQTQRITAHRLDQRLHLPEIATELMPWITQFNGLMDRLQAAIDQLEAFNADVAHELRTPLASLMGHTEVALSRDRSAKELREVMTASLEELQQMSQMVQDMLFLSRTDRGARARAADIPSLRILAEKVVDFHAIGFDEAGLRAKVHGDARICADEPLLQRALSNLIDNAVQHAGTSSRIDVLIERQPRDRVALLVQNSGSTIAEADLPRIFDRFFRADASRPSSGQHHGLGLAIVAAIARMHGGEPLAQSSDGLTRVGICIPNAPVTSS